MNNINNVLKSILFITREPTSTQSQTEDGVEDKDPGEEINRVERDGVGKILDGNLVCTPCNHGHDR